MNTSLATAESAGNYVIGFATKFYTLWSTSEHTVDAGGGKRIRYTEYCYCGKISTSRETAMSKYPGLAIDENLRGKTRSWTRQEYIWDNVDMFRFGKYKGGEINENCDAGYLEWYFGAVEGEHRDYVASVLRKLGYVIEGSVCYSPDVLKEMADAKEAKERVISAANEGVQVRLFIGRNPDEDGAIRVDNPAEEGYLNTDGLRFRFREVAERYYDGYVYYMPCVNGKAKRVKGKTILATISYNPGEDVFCIEKFTVDKAPKNSEA